MTLSALGVTAVYYGLGSPGPFSLQDDDANPILFENDSEIVVKTAGATGEYGATVLLVQGVNYTLTGAGLIVAGAVTLTAPLPLGTLLIIRRKTPKTQTLDLLYGGSLDLENLEETVDKIVRITQELGEQTDRAFLFSASETAFIDTRSRIVPAPLPESALVWNTSNQLENRALSTLGTTGPQGDPGIQGARGRASVGLRGDAGEDGSPGIPGPRGRIGLRGRPGRPGITGDDGEDSGRGPPGRRGQTGLRGARGFFGTPGNDGEDIQGIPGRRATIANSIFNGSFTQSQKGGFWMDVSPFVNIARFDRVFVGEGSNVNGNFSGSQGSIIPTDTEGGKYLGGRDVQLLSIAETGLVAISGVSRSSDQNAAPTASIGVAGYCINDKASGLGWGMYTEVQHESAATAGYGIEIDAKNKGSNISYNPYSASGAGTYGAWIVAGGDTAYGGSPANPSAAAIVIKKNAHTWNTGIVFGKDSITGDDGTTGTGIAIDMAKGHTLRWMLSSSAFGAAIRSDVATSGKDVQMLFSDDLVAFYGSNGKEIFSANRPTAAAVNNIRVYSAATGVAPTVAAIGDDTNVDLTLSPQGTGVTRSANIAALPINMQRAAAVNFNSANSDTQLAIKLPTGYTRYRINQIIISGASATITTATWGLFTAAAGGGTAISAAGQPITVSSASESTVNNMMVVAPASITQNLQSFNNTTLFFRVGTAQGSAATATVTIIYSPVS